MEHESQFNPEWSFMDDPNWKRVQLLLDDSFYQGDTADSRAQALMAFEIGLKEAIAHCLDQPEVNQDVRNAAKFLEINRRFFDKGGMNIGRSRQSNLADEMWKQLVTKFPELLTK